MKFRPSEQHRERTLLVDITPMIDVVFLLIVFFLATAQFAKFTRADVDLPDQPGEGEKTGDEPGIVINIISDGTIIVGDMTLDLEGLRDLMRREVQNQQEGLEHRGMPLIRADQNLPTAVVNEVVKVMQDMGYWRGGFGTEVIR